MDICFPGGGWSLGWSQESSLLLGAVRELCLRCADMPSSRQALVRRHGLTHNCGTPACLPMSPDNSRATAKNPGPMRESCCAQCAGHLYGTFCDLGHVAVLLCCGWEPHSVVFDLTVCVPPIPKHSCFLQTHLCSTCAPLVTLL